MDINVEPTSSQRRTLEYLAADRTQRKEMEAPTRRSALALWREGILEASWRYNDRSGTWRRSFSVPEDVRTQLDRNTIQVQLSSTYSAILATASILWDTGQVDSFDKWYETRGSEYKQSEKTHRKVAVVSDKRIVNETGIPLDTVRDGIKWLDRRGFAVRVKEQWDPESSTMHAIDEIKGYGFYADKSRNPMYLVREANPEIRLPKDLPADWIEAIRKSNGVGDFREDGNVLVLQVRKSSKFILDEHPNDSYFTPFGDIPLSIQPELIKRAAEKLKARSKDPSIYDFEEAVQREYQMFLCHAEIVCNADEEDSTLPEDVLKKLIEDEIRSTLREGLRFTPRRIDRARNLLKSDSHSQFQSQNSAKT